MTTAELKRLARKALVDDRTATRWLAGLPVRPAMATRLTEAQRGLAALDEIDREFGVDEEGGGMYGRVIRVNKATNGAR